MWPPLLAIAAAFQADIGRSRFPTTRAQGHSGRTR